MGQLYSLEFLSLVDNPIEEIPESLVQLTKLKDVRTDKKLTIPQKVVETRVCISFSIFINYSLPNNLIQRMEELFSNF